MGLAQNRSVERQHLFSATDVARGRSVSLSLSLSFSLSFRRRAGMDRAEKPFRVKTAHFLLWERKRIPQRRERERSQQRGCGRGAARAAFCSTKPKDIRKLSILRGKILNNARPVPLEILNKVVDKQQLLQTPSGCPILSLYIFLSHLYLVKDE